MLQPLSRSAGRTADDGVDGGAAGTGFSVGEAEPNAGHLLGAVKLTSKRLSLHSPLLFVRSAP